MLKKFFSNKKKKEEETEIDPTPFEAKPAGKIVIKKRTPAKIQSNFVPSEEPFDPNEQDFIENENVDFEPHKFSDEAADGDSFDSPAEGSQPEIMKIEVDEDADFANDINDLEEQLGTLDAEREQLSSDLDIAQKVIQDLRLQLGEKDNLNSELTSQNAKLSEDITQLKQNDNPNVVQDLNSRLEEAEGRIKKLVSERNLALDELEVVRKQYDELNQKIGTLKDSSKGANKEKQEAESEIQILQAMVNRLEAEQQELESEFNEKLNAAEEENEKLSAQIKGTVEQVDQLEEQVQNLQVEKVALEKQEQIKVKKIADQKAALTSLKKEKADLFKSLKEIEAGSSSDQSAMEYAQNEIEKLKKVIKEKQGDAENFQELIKQEQKLVSEAEGLTRKAEKELEKKVNELEKERSAHGETQQKLEKEKSERAKQKKQITELEVEVKKIDFFMLEVDKLNAEIEKKVALQEELKSKLSEAQVSNKETIKENIQNGKEIEKLKAENEKLSSSVDHLKATLKEKSKESDSAGKDLAEYKNRIKAAEEKVDELSKALTSLQAEHEKLKSTSEQFKSKVESEKKGLEEKLKVKEKEVEEISKALAQKKEESSKLAVDNAELSLEVAKVNKQLIQTATKLAAASVPMPEKEPEIKPTKAAVAEEKQDTPAVEQEPMPETLTVNVSIIPQGDEFELEVPADITGMNIISELIDAEVLNEEMNFAINVKRTGEAIGGEDTLWEIGVRDDDLIIIDTN